MHVSGELEGIIEFGPLKDVLPLDGLDLEGRMTSDLRVDTRMSYIETEKYEEVNIDGLLLLEGLKVETPDIQVPLEIARLEMNFNPRYVDLTGADLQLGKSDLHMEGSLSNFIPYLFAGETVSGALKVSSAFFDSGEWMTETEEPGLDSSGLISEIPTDTLYQPDQFKIPENIDFLLEVDIQKLIYDDIPMERMSGEVRFREGVAYMSGLELDMIGGHVKVKGNLDTRGELTTTDFTLDITGMDVPSAYSTFVTVERLAPMAKYCKGDANMIMDFSSRLDASLSPLYETINASGRIFTKDLQIYNMSSFVRLSELLKNEKFREMAPDDMNIKFRVKEGKVLVDPFDVSFGKSKMTVSGLHGLDMTLDYLLDMKIAKADMGKGAGEVLDGVSAMALSAGFKIPATDFVKIKAMIRGTFQDPQITTDLSDNLSSGKAEVRKMVEERVTEEVQKVEEEIREEASKKADEILKQAEEEVAVIMEEARKTGEQLVREAEKQGENLVKEAGSNPLKKAAAKKAADELLRQANKQSENLIRMLRSDPMKFWRKPKQKPKKFK